MTFQPPDYYNTNILSYAGYPLSYQYETTSYDQMGNMIGTIRVGRDADGKLCVEDGRFLGGKRINGETLYLYQTHTGTVGIKI